MAIHSSILAGIIPWTEKSGGQQPMGSQQNIKLHSSRSLLIIYLFMSFFFYLFKKLFYLVALGLSSDTWDLAPWPGIEHLAIVLGAWSSATGPPGKPQLYILYTVVCVCVHHKLLIYTPRPSHPQILKVLSTRSLLPRQGLVRSQPRPVLTGTSIPQWSRIPL